MQAENALNAKPILRLYLVQDLKEQPIASALTVVTKAITISSTLRIRMIIGAQLQKTI